MKIDRLLTIIAVLILISDSALCQKSNSKTRLRSIIVTEEKNDVLIRKQMKESETYYDPKGNIIEEIKYKQGKVSKHFKYHFDQDGKKIKEEEFNSSGDIIEYSEYKYENGLRVEKIVCDDKGKVKSRKIYQYTTC
jgi:hypothetical protein